MSLKNMLVDPIRKIILLRLILAPETLFFTKQNQRGLLEVLLKIIFY